MNLAKDALRHQRMSASKEPAIIAYLDQTIADFRDRGKPTEHEIRDDALRLMFVCAHPAIATDAQVVLALKVLCGFSIGGDRARFSEQRSGDRETAHPHPRSASRKRGIGFEIPEGEDLAPRLDGVLAALYLLFNEGYKASAGDSLLREELVPRSDPAGLAPRRASRRVDTPRSHALLALMLLSSARFPTRLNEQGDLLRLDDQDRSQWDQAFIDRGLIHLAAAADGGRVSDYHLQAGIAACHCMAPDSASTDWKRILRHYDQLHAAQSLAHRRP